MNVPAGRLDHTTFTVGPNSDMALDEFVYDPSTGRRRAKPLAPTAFY